MSGSKTILNALKTRLIKSTIYLYDSNKHEHQQGE